MKKLLFGCLITLFATTSCKSTLASVSSTPLAVNEAIRPLDADISVDVNTKIEGRSESLYFLFFRIKGDSKYAEGVDYSTKSGLLPSLKVERAKASAAFKAVKSSGCDVIVHPNYEVNVMDYVFFKKIDVKVTGYAGTINRIFRKTRGSTANYQITESITVLN